MNRLSRVAVVGAGAGGLCTASRFKQLGVEKIKIFESASRLGGTWRYVDDPKDDPCSSMYKNLLTNLPTKVMNFPDFPFPEKTDAFPSHSVILKYLEEYAKRQNLNENIKFNNPVETCSFDESTKSWKINDENFDFVVVANGHYTKPSVPEMFQNSLFEGEIMHTHYYRRAESLAGKNVLVIGQGPSGQDISLDLLGIANSVALLGRSEIKGTPDSLRKFIGWAKEVKPNGVLTNNNELIECDFILLASGYCFDFPFLDENLIEYSACKKKIQPLYKQIIHSRYPSLAFIGIPCTIVPFPLMDCQAQWLAQVWKGNVKLPSTEERLKEAAKIPGIGSPDIDRHFHKMSNAQWKYDDDLAKEASFEPIPRTIQDLYREVWGVRSKQGPAVFRNVHYKDYYD